MKLVYSGPLQTRDTRPPLNAACIDCGAKPEGTRRLRCKSCREKHGKALLASLDRIVADRQRSTD